ncbi:hypothetical protein BKA81DRAFT_365993 [Phyllosticta paracitricarpa]
MPPGIARLCLLRFRSSGALVDSNEAQRGFRLHHGVMAAVSCPHTFPGTCLKRLVRLVSKQLCHNRGRSEGVCRNGQSSWPITAADAAQAGGRECKQHVSPSSTNACRYLRPKLHMLILVRRLPGGRSRRCGHVRGFPVVATLPYIANEIEQSAVTLQ